ncbi:MAG: Lrp/AsnC family transcriptional regulator [Azoarcus sp.]|jgi:DNA-binding Lrp family transcriptional regulator|nr:Lrp/AsnC family transcriptional regulator [Azoarcus sp.]
MSERWREPGFDAALDAIDRRIVDALQEGFPLCPRPYAEAAARLGLDEAELIARLDALLARKALTRFGPLFQIERLGGAFTLAALSVPEEDWERVAALLDAMPEVAHNYRREHRWNMWFVVAAASVAAVEATLARIESATGLAVLALPKEKEYRVDMRLKVRSAA